MVETRKINGNTELWPKGLTAQLVELWTPHVLSASRIADKLGVTRNAVIGKAHRLGLSSKKQQQPAERKPRQAPNPARSHRREPAEPPSAAILVMPAEFLNRTLEEIGQRDCRYPHGDRAPFLFCGQPVLEGSSYCAEHHGIAYHRATPHWREPLREPLKRWGCA
jgi:GcrA cell cycle regulator